MRVMLDYLDWQSNISLEQVFAGSDGFSHPTMVPNVGTLYLSSLKAEKSRSVLMLIRQGSTESKCITPAPYSLQTKVNEYGGKPYWTYGENLYFANASDQCLYQQSLINLELAPKRITEPSVASERLMFTDIQQFSNDDLLAITEQIAKPENVMSITALSGSNAKSPRTLVEGADFYSNLVLNKSATQLAWVQWQHPNMPWDANELWLADVFDESGEVQLKTPHRIELPVEFGQDACVCQLLFANNGDLFFSADFSATDSSNSNNNVSAGANFWNVYVYRAATKTVSRVTNGKAEYGYPHWVYGDHRIVQLDAERLISVASYPTGDTLSVIHQDTLDIQEHIKPSSNAQAATLQHLSSDGFGKVVFESLPYDQKGALLELDFSAQKCDHSNNESVVAKTLISQGAEISNLSQAQHLEYATRDGKSAYGFYYPPSNSDYQTKIDTSRKPPLLVMVHGGPTSRAYGHFDIQKQFWTSRGFAILDVNHRGSSGYGRAYRDALYGEWGELDASDIIDGIEHLVQQGKADASRVCIRGKSAGGYAVLRALTEFPETFKAGACYYGIGNLLTLAETTHKFEKYYTDRLLGEAFDPATASKPSSRFHQRSPINKIDQVGSAMIVFQGLLDKVVPPSVAQEIVNALKAAELDYDYIEYPDEAHGFRQVANNIDAWGKELAFYRRVLKPN